MRRQPKRLAAPAKAAARPLTLIEIAPLLLLLVAIASGLVWSGMQQPTSEPTPPPPPPKVAQKSTPPAKPAANDPDISREFSRLNGRLTRLERRLNAVERQPKAWWSQ